MVPIFVLICIILFLSTVRPITVLIHELGHAIPSLLFTKNKVEIYIGSYGDPKNGFILNFFRLTIFFKYNPFQWNLGLCSHDDMNISLVKQFVIILLGPLTSIIFGVSVCYLFLDNFEDGRVIFLGFIILASSLIDFYFNIVPNSNPIRLYNGTIIYNDGQQLLQIIKYGILPKDYRKANDFYRAKKYSEAGFLYEKLINQGTKDSTIFQLAISAFLMAEELQLAENLIINYSTKYKKNSDTLTNIGVIYSKNGKANKSIDFYNEALKINPQNVYALNNRGFQRNLNKEFKAAINDFNKVIELESNFAYAFSNRGYAKIKIGLEEEGLLDILKSIELDKENSYAFRNLGIYYICKKDRANALKNLEIALKLDETTPQIQELIKEAKKIKNAQNNV